VSHEQLVRETWAALAGGDFDAVAAAFAPDARWHAVDEESWSSPGREAACESRAQILEVLRNSRAAGALRGAVEEVRDVGEDRALVAFRPSHHDPDAWPLDNGIRYVVLTLDERGLVSELKGCADRRTALAYAGASD
jgi:ketosteroid isomerase-like protein